MNFCSKCGSQVNPNATACGNCGAPFNQQPTNPMQSTPVSPQPDAQSMQQSTLNIPPTMANPFVQQPTSQPAHNGYQSPILPSDEKKGKTKTGVIACIIAVVLIAAGLAGYYFLTSSPKYVYQNMYKQMVNRVLDIVPEKNTDIIDKTLSLSVNIDLEDEIDSELIDLINTIKLSTNYQYDNNTKELVLKLDADYGKNSLIDAAVYANLKNSELYILAKDYYDKYVKVPVEDITADFDTSLSAGQIANIKKFKKLFAKELVKVIEAKDVRKENGKYILEISSQEIAKRYGKIFKEIADNKAILDCFNDEYRKDVEQAFKGASEYFEETAENLSEEKIKITIIKAFIGNGIKQLTMEVEESKLVFDVTKGKVEYKLVQSSEDVLTGYFKYDEGKATSKYEVLITIPELGSFKANFELKDKKVNSIEKVDSAKVIELENITESEMLDIMDQFENSKLYELIQQFASIFDIEDAHETMAIAEANYVASGIESGCALSKFTGDDICSDGVTITEALEFVSILDNTNIEYISYFDGAVHYLRLITNGKTVIYNEGDVTVY